MKTMTADNYDGYEYYENNVSSENYDYEYYDNDPVSFSKGDGEIAFNFSDLTIKKETLSGSYVLEAYRDILNDQIINASSASQYARLRWAALGEPKLVKIRSIDKNEFKKFQFSEEVMYTYIEMLTKIDAARLAEQASEKFSIQINSSQIVQLIPHEMSCQVRSYDKENIYSLYGSVHNFKSFPLRLEFVAPYLSFERAYFKENLTPENEVCLKLLFLVFK